MTHDTWAVRPDDTSQKLIADFKIKRPNWQWSEIAKWAMIPKWLVTQLQPAPACGAYVFWIIFESQNALLQKFVKEILSFYETLPLFV